MKHRFWIIALASLMVACGPTTAETDPVPTQPATTTGLTVVTVEATEPSDEPTVEALFTAEAPDAPEGYPGATPTPVEMIDLSEAYPGGTPTPFPTPEPLNADAYPAEATDLDSATTLGAPLLAYTIVAQYPHDSDAFTQGFDFDESGQLYEGTGLWGRSSLREVDLESGEVEQMVALDDTYFGEGITIFDDRIIQITWQSRTGFVYDKETLEQIDTWSYDTEGWGLTHDGERLIMSDGTATITFRDPNTLEAIGTLDVADANGPVTRLNELEYIDGLIWANIWQTDQIALIDPATGEVVNYLDLTGLLSSAETTGNEDVLNGIAYNEATDQLFVTGKLWPAVFELEITQ